MEARAIAKYIRISPKKARPVADLVRGKKLQKAYDILAHTGKRAAEPIAEAIRSAQANLEDQDPASSPQMTKVKELRIDEGPTLKRWLPRAMGRATPINKRSSHITVVVSNNETEEL